MYGMFYAPQTARACGLPRVPFVLDQYLLRAADGAARYFIVYNLINRDHLLCNAQCTDNPCTDCAYTDDQRADGLDGC